MKNSDVAIQAKQKKKPKRHGQRLPQDLKPRFGGRLGTQQQLLFVSGSPVPQLAYLWACSRGDTQREEITDVVTQKLDMASEGSVLRREAKMGTFKHVGQLDGQDEK